MEMNHLSANSVEMDTVTTAQVTKSDDIVSKNMTENMERKELVKLRRFQVNITKATDLFKTAAEGLKYSLGGHSSMKNLISDSWQSAEDDLAKQEVREVVGGICRLILEASRDAIASLAEEKGIAVDLETPGTWPIYASCNGSMLAQVTGNCMVLFHAIYEARSVSDVFSEEELANMNEVYLAASKIIKSIGADGFGITLPDNVIATLGGSSKIGKKSKDTVEIVNADFMVACEEVFRQLASKQYDIEEMTRLAEVPIIGALYEAKQLMQRFSMHLPSVANVFDIRVMGAYLKLIKRVFDKCQNIDGVMRQFYLDSLEETNELPSLKRQCAGFDAEFIRLMNGMGDHAQFQNEPEKLENIVREFAFLFMIAPKATIWLILKECINNKLIVPNILKVLRRLPSFLELRLAMSGVEDCLSTRRVPVITLALRRIVQKESDWIANDETRANFVYLVASLARERRAASKRDQEVDENVPKYGEVIDAPILSGTELLLDFVLPMLFLKSEIDIALDLACRFFADYECRRTPIEWSVEVDELNEVAMKGHCFTRIPAAMCVKLLVDILSTDVDRNPTVEGLCLKCLHLLGEKLKEEGVFFPEKTCAFILESLSTHAWTLKYAICSWFFESLGKPKLQVPEGLYKSLSEERQRVFEQITVDFEFAPVECFLKSIFDLAVLCTDLALDLINGGFSLKPLDEELSVKVALALMESIPDNATNEKVTTIYEVVKALVIALDPTVKTNPFVFCNESTIYGLRLVSPLLVFGDAVLLAMRAVSSKRSCRNQQVAEKLLSVWCQLAKGHIEREVIDLRRSRLSHVSDIRNPRPLAEGVVIDRLTRVKIQITEIFSMAVMITKEAENISPQLRILLVTLADHDVELNQMAAGSVLDAVKTDSKDEGTFYAFARDEKAEGSAVAKENAVPSEGTTPATLPNGTENKQQPDRQGTMSDAMLPTGERKLRGEGMSATNALFEINAGNAMLARSPRYTGPHSGFDSHMPSFDRRDADKRALSPRNRRGWRTRWEVGGRGRRGRVSQKDGDWIRRCSDGRDEEAVEDETKVSPLDDNEISSRSGFKWRATEVEKEPGEVRAASGSANVRSCDEKHSPDISEQSSTNASAERTSKPSRGRHAKKIRSHDEGAENDENIVENANDQRRIGENDIRSDQAGKEATHESDGFAREVGSEGKGFPHKGISGTHKVDTLKQDRDRFTYKEQGGNLGSEHDYSKENRGWKGYKARSAIHLEQRPPQDGPEGSAAFKGLSTKVSAATEQANIALKAMVEQVKDVPTREVLRRRMDSKGHPIEPTGGHQSSGLGQTPGSLRHRSDNEAQFLSRPNRGRGGGPQKSGKKGKRN